MFGCSVAVPGRRQCIPDLCYHETGRYHVTPFFFDLLSKLEGSIVVLVVLNDERDDKARV